MLSCKGHCRAPRGVGLGAPAAPAARRRGCGRCLLHAAAALSGHEPPVCCAGTPCIRRATVQAPGQLGGWRNQCCVPSVVSQLRPPKNSLLEGLQVGETSGGSLRGLLAMSRSLNSAGRGPAHLTASSGVGDPSMASIRFQVPSTISSLIGAAAVTGQHARHRNRKCCKRSPSRASVNPDIDHRSRERLQ